MWFEGVTRWLGEVKKLPTLWRILIALAGAGTGALFSARAGWDPASALPYAPLVALAFGIAPALAAWVAVAVALFVMASGSAMILPTLALIAVLTWALPWRQGLTISALMFGVAGGAYLADEPELPLVVVMVLMFVAVVCWYPYERYRRGYETRSAEVEDLREQQERIRREERQRLAHELHDIVAHEVTVIAMQARRAQLVGQLNEKADGIVGGIGDAAQQALSDLRRLVVLLKEDDNEPPEGDPSGETTSAEGLAYDLDRVVAALEKAGFTVIITREGDIERIPRSVLQSLRRTVRELGTNILKHADVREAVELTLIVAGASVELAATNTPSHARPISSSDTGLAAMRQRAELFGGSLKAGAESGRWTTSMTLPLS